MKNKRLRDEAVRGAAGKPSPPEYYLKPGYLYVTEEPACLVTVLGSCVSVCLYDRRLRYGGMNHYQLPEPLPLEPPSTRFGVTSIEQLIATLGEFGSRIGDLKAHVVGGAFIEDHEQSRLVADLNIEMALRRLGEWDIRIASRDTGGKRGRKIWFYTDSGRLVVSFLHNGGEAPEENVEFEL